MIDGFILQNEESIDVQSIPYEGQLADIFPRIANEPDISGMFNGKRMTEFLKGRIPEVVYMNAVKSKLSVFHEIVSTESFAYAGIANNLDFRIELFEMARKFKQARALQDLIMNDLWQTFPPHQVHDY
jgi:hypothetical protein